MLTEAARVAVPVMEALTVALATIGAAIEIAAAVADVGTLAAAVVVAVVDGKRHESCGCNQKTIPLPQ
jgi:hypothetical protein